MKKSLNMKTPSNMKKLTTPKGTPNNNTLPKLPTIALSIVLASTLTLSSNAFATGTNAPVTESASEKSDQKALYGLGIGSVAGAIVAGPLGAVVAGMFGASIGTSEMLKDQTTAQANELAATRQELSDAQQNLLAVTEQLQMLEEQAVITQVSTNQPMHVKVLDMRSNVQFRTGSHELEPDYHAQLTLIADALQRFPELTVTLTGYADNRGDEDYNQALSMQRALRVKNFLVSAGVADTQIMTLARGEIQGQDVSMESAFFDRKVEIQMSGDKSMMTAGNH